MSADRGYLNHGTRRSRTPGCWYPRIRKNTGAGDTVLLRLSYFSKTTLATSKLLWVCTVLLCSVVGWCQLAWGTMETRFVYFFIVKWTMHSACFYQHIDDTNLPFWSQSDAISKLNHISMPYFELYSNLAFKKLVEVTKWRRRIIFFQVKGKEAHWSLRGLIVKSAEHCGADYKPLDRFR